MTAAVHDACNALWAGRRLLPSCSSGVANEQVLMGCCEIIGDPQHLLQVFAERLVRGGRTPIDDRVQDGAMLADENIDRGARGQAEVADPIEMRLLALDHVPHVAQGRASRPRRRPWRVRLRGPRARLQLRSRQAL